MSNLQTILKQEISTAKAYLNDVAKDMNVGHKKFCEWELTKLAKMSSIISTFERYAEVLANYNPAQQWVVADVKLTAELKGFAFDESSSESSRVTSKSRYEALVYLKDILSINGKVRNQYNLVDTSGVDWALLRAQKAAIVDLIGSGRLMEDETSALNGMVGLLDSIQDQMATIMGDELIFGAQE